MKMQWMLLFGLLFAICIAVFAIVNVKQVPVDYVFGEAQWPLILIILGSALIGAVISACFAGIRMFGQQRKFSLVDKQVKAQQNILVEKDGEILRLKNELNLLQAEIAKHREVADDFGRTF